MNLLIDQQNINVLMKEIYKFEFQVCKKTLKRAFSANKPKMLQIYDKIMKLFSMLYMERKFYTDATLQNTSLKIYVLKESK